MENTQPRGVRNNNLTNIKKNALNPWRGEIKNPKERTFCTFQTRAYGYRATFIILRNYQQKHGCRTLAEHISRWAPASENDSKRYVRFVSNFSNYPEGVTLDHGDAQMMCAIVRAMVVMETGVHENPDTIYNGYVMAQSPM